MTNTLHRQGELESLKHDYIIFAHTAKGKNREGSAEKNREFDEFSELFSLRLFSVFFTGCPNRL